MKTKTMKTGMSISSLALLLLVAGTAFGQEIDQVEIRIPIHLFAQGGGASDYGQLLFEGEMISTNAISILSRSRMAQQPKWGEP